MRAVSDFHFLRPLWLLLIPVGMAAIWYLRHRHHAASRWREWVDDHLIDVLLSGGSQAGTQVTIGLSVCCIVASIALAGPTWEKKASATHQVQQGRVLIMDLSASMRARDIAPSRLSRAKFKLVDLIKSGGGMYQGLVVFAGDTYVAAPMTDDMDTLLHLVRELDSSTLPGQGSRLDRALQAAERLFKNAGLPPGQIVAIVDGATPHAHRQAEELGQRGFQLLILIAGTARGAPIPGADGGLIKDAAGNIVIAAVDQAQLISIARMANGDARFIAANDEDIQWVEQARKSQLAFSRSQKISGDTPLMGDQWHDRGYLLIPILVFLCAMLFRRGWLLVLLINLPLMDHSGALAGNEQHAGGQSVSQEAAASGGFAGFWSRLWLRPEQIAARQFADENYTGMADDAPPPWQAAAKYRQGEYLQAAALLSAADTRSADDLYNQGNALALAGKLHEAVAAYDEALALDTGHEDALHNKTVVEKLLQQSQQNRQDSTQGGENSPQTAEQNHEQKAADAGQPSSGGQDDSQQQGTDRQQTAAHPDSQPGQDESRIGSETTGSDPANIGEPPDSPRSEHDEARSRYTQDSEADSETDSEGQYSASQQAIRQLLERIPDDSGGILKRKFARQSAERNRPAEMQTW